MKCKLFTQIHQSNPLLTWNGISKSSFDEGVRERSMRARLESFVPDLLRAMDDRDIAEEDRMVWFKFEESSHLSSGVNVTRNLVFSKTVPVNLAQFNLKNWNTLKALFIDAMNEIEEDALGVNLENQIKLKELKLNELDTLIFNKLHELKILRGDKSLVIDQLQELHHQLADFHENQEG